MRRHEEKDVTAAGLAVEAMLRHAARTSVEELLATLGTGPEGLTWPEAERRLAAHGLNEAVPHKVTPWWRVLWRSFRTPFNYILVFLGVVSYLTDDLKATIVMGIMVTAATLLRFWQEMRSQVKVESLRRLVRTQATVYRAANHLMPGRTVHEMDHNASDIPIEQLVPGDIVKLSAGDMIPADVRLLEARDFFVSQAALTGEAMPVEKTAASNGAADAAVVEIPTLCFMGSSVVGGTAKGLVISTGPRTLMGTLATKVVQERPLTSFDRGVHKVSWLLIRFMMVMVPVVFVINGVTKGDWLEAFFFGVAVAVGLTPEMLPMIVNTNLARGAVAMSREKVVVKNMNAIQNFGAMDVLCTDKTGTLTQDRVVLIKHLDASNEDSDRVLELAYVNSVFQTGLKNLLDRAVIEHAREDHDVRELAQTMKLLDELPFDFTRRRMSVVVESSSGARLLVCKGAVEEMLSACASVEIKGRIEVLTDERRRALLDIRDEYNTDGIRLVAVAYKGVNKRPGEYSVADEAELIFAGYVAFLDPPKETAADALRLLAQHNVAVKIVTGDVELVTRKVCRDVGLEVQGVLRGEELHDMSDEELRERVETTNLFVKLTPEQKARVVKAFKANGHTVGF